MTDPDEKLSIEHVVRQGLCLSCGSCVAVCPAEAVEMHESAGGLLLATVNHEKCRLCGLCVNVCPGTHLEKGLLDAGSDPFKGPVQAAYCGQAVDEKLLSQGQSGGAIAATLCYLLGSGKIKKVAVTEMPEDGSLRPKCAFTGDQDEVRRAQGSQYCPVALNSILSSNIHELDDTTALVGLPCHIHGLRNMLSRLGRQDKPAVFTIGLLCGRTLSYVAIDRLLQQAGEERQSAQILRYRSKAWRGWPGDIYVRNNSGGEKYLPRGYRYEIKDILSPLACRLCFDLMNVLSDLAVGDPFNIKDDKKGWSIVLARTVRGNNALLAAKEAGVLRLEPLDPEDFFAAQRIEKRRRDWTAFTDVWQSLDGRVPDFGIDRRYRANIENLDLRAYRKRIELSLRLASARSAEDVMRATERAVRIHRLRTFSFVSSPLRRVKRMLGEAIRIWR